MSTYQFKSLAHAEKLRVERQRIADRLKNAAAEREAAEGLLASVLGDEQSTPKQIAVAREALPKAIEAVRMLEHEGNSYDAAITASMARSRDAAAAEFVAYYEEIRDAYTAATKPIPLSATLRDVADRSAELSVLWGNLCDLRRTWGTLYDTMPVNLTELAQAREKSSDIHWLAEKARKFFSLQERWEKTEPPPMPTAPPPPEPMPEPKQTPEERKRMLRGAYVNGELQR